VEADQNILEHGKTEDWSGLLKRTRNAELCDIGWQPAVYSLSFKRDLTRIGPDEAADQPDQGRLARTIRSDETVYRSRMYG
jgi:hypothetical protein